MNRRLADVFADARSQGRAALIGYLPAGFPDRDTCVDLIATMIECGVDVIEVGLPYSDPLMDGAAIQEAVERALMGGTTTDVVLDTVRRVSEAGAVAAVMSYWNPIERYGVQRFAAELAKAGGVGVITPDLTPEEAGAWIEATDDHGIDRIFLVAPSSSNARIATVVSATSGFVYAASTMGVTGARSSVSSGAGDLVARTRPHTNLPIAVGLGVSTGEQAAEVAKYADGVIVGSAFIRLVLDAPDATSARDSVAELTRELAAGVRLCTP